MVSQNAVRCTSCGGPLIRKSEIMWFCEYCSNEYMVSDGTTYYSKQYEASKSSHHCNTVRCKIFVECDDDIKVLKIEGDFVISSSYRRRTTMADVCPMCLAVNCSDRIIVIADRLENVGEGLIKLKNESGQYHFESIGDIKFTANGIHQIYGCIENKLLIKIGSVIIWIKQY